MEIGLLNVILGSACPGNELIADEHGRYSVMVRIPKMTLAQLGLADSDQIHPAFVVNGKEVQSLYISKYENVIADNGCGYSVSGVTPSYGITKEEAYACCVKKGKGWHLWTRQERALLSQICKKTGIIPRGNNDFGKDSQEDIALAIPGTIGPDGKTNAVLTGTGPSTWTHDGTAAGIWNLKGNIWEWNGGIRLVYGELQVLPDNDGADSSNSQDKDSPCWRAISGADGSYIRPDGKGTTEHSLKLNWTGSGWRWQTGKIEEPGLHCGLFEEIQTDSSVCEKAELLLKILGLCPQDHSQGAYEGSVFWAHSGEEETAFDCGGRWNGGTQPSVFTFSASHPRDFLNDFAGFRCAYIQMEED